MIAESNILKRFIPFLGTALIVLGFVKLKLYYNRFNIDIENYLELTEVLVLFMSDIVYYGIIMFIFMFFFFMVETDEELENLNETKEAIEEESSFRKRLQHHYKLNAPILWFFAILYLGLIPTYFYAYDRFWDIFLSTVGLPIMILYVIVIMEFRNKYKRRYGENWDPSINNIILIVFMFGLYSISSVTLDIQKVYKKADKTINFVYEDDEVETSPRLKYLGETRNYIFMYDNKNKKSSVYQKSDVTDFTITYIEG